MPPRWRGWPTRVPRAAPASGARRRSRSSRRTAHRSRSGARRRPGADLREVARVVRATLADFGLTGWPKTRGRAASTSTCASSAAGRSAKCAGPRWRCARGRAAGAGPRDEQVVEGGAARRVPRLQPERQGPHHCRAPTRSADARGARLGAAGVDEIDACDPVTSRWRQCRRACTALGDRHAGIDDDTGRSPACSSSRRATRRDGQGDAPWPPQYRKQRRRAAARAAVAAPRSSRPLIEIGRASGQGGCIAGRALATPAIPTPLRI